MPSISRLILMVAALEWVIWFLVKQYVRDVPTCPVCKKQFQWREIETYNNRGYRELRRTSFPCPKCREIIGVPSWRKSFLALAYFVLLTGFLFVFFEIHPAGSTGDLILGYTGAVLGSFGAIMIANWFIWRKLEPGRPSPFT
jgi:hypothetical protein